VIKEPPTPQQQPQQQPLPFDHNLDQRPTYPAQTQAAAFSTEIPIEISRARYESAISTESTLNSQEALDRGVNHATPLDATQDDAHEVKKDRDKLSPDSLAPQQQQAQTQTHAEPAPTKAAELEIEGPELDLGGLIL
jgi:hypothetical protein